MTPNEATWLMLFTRGAVKPLATPPLDAAEAAFVDSKNLLAKEEELFRKRREAEIARSLAVINEAKQGIMDGLDMKFDVDGKKARTADKRGDASKVFDSDEASRITSKQDVGSAYSDAVMKAMKTFAPLAEENKRLGELTGKRHVWTGGETQRVLTETTVPLFEDAQLMKDWYTPLVRELVVPENFVPDRYSNTKKMLDASSDAYIDECKEKGKEPGRGLADLSKGVVMSAATAATAGFPAHSDLNMIITGTALAIDSGIDGLSAVQKAFKHRTIDVDSWEAVGLAAATAIGQIAGGAVGNDNLGDSYGQMTAGCVRGFFTAGRVAKWATEVAKDPNARFPWEDLANELLQIGATALTDQADTNTSGSQSDRQGIGAAAAGAIGTTLSAAVKGLDGVSFKSPKDMAKALTKVLATAVTESAKGALNAENNIQENALGADNETNTAMNQSTARMTGALDTTRAKADEAIESMADKMFGADQTPEDRKKQREQERKEDQAELADAEERLAAEREADRKTMDQLGRMDDDATDDDFKSIAKLVAKMERDRKILAAATMVGGVSAAVAAQFFAPLKAAQALIQFAVNVHAACERASALMAWRDTHKEALTSVSPYLTSIQNFISNQTAQLTHHSIQAALNAAEAACAMAECGYPPVKAATVAVTAAVMLEQTVYEFAKKMQLRQAWKSTKLAMEHPENRKYGLVARKMNPTLAKYTIAYGAVIEKAPVAIAAMSRCGLDRETLANASSGLAAVKEYLQTLYVEDGVLLGPIPQGPGRTSLPKPSLDETTWLLTVELWKKEVGLPGHPPAGIRLGLSERQKLDGIDATKLDLDGQKRHLDEQIEVLTGLEASFGMFEPQVASEQVLKSIEDVLQLYAALAWAAAELKRQDRDQLDLAPPADTLQKAA